MTVDCWKRRWYLWVFVVFFLLLNVHGWHVSFWIAFAAFIALIITITGTILELILAWLALKIYENYAREIGPLDLLIQRSDKPLWFPPPSLVLHLIRFILFQNAFQIAIFLWIGITFGFDSCMMGQLYYHVTKLIIGGCTLGLCGYSTLPLYTIVTELENAFNKRLMILSKEE
ncbi:Seven transmembrane MLO family protein [Trifolium repens]|nr:Seven transmembrane MLO family protein [Trifolium repens]